jgi:hypothetical protein
LLNSVQEQKPLRRMGACDMTGVEKEAARLQVQTLDQVFDHLPTRRRKRYQLVLNQPQIVTTSHVS